MPEEGPEFDSVEWAELPRERALAVIEESRQQAQRWKKVGTRLHLDHVSMSTVYFHACRLPFGAASVMQ